MLNLEDTETYLLVLEVAGPYGVDPSSSLEAEDFFNRLLATYAGVLEPEVVASWLDGQIARAFTAIGDYPRWIQSSAWPFDQGEPLIFIAQIDLAVTDYAALAHIFHDDTSLYLFLKRNGEFEIVTQQY